MDEIKQQYLTREHILKLLSDSEIASLSRAEDAISLAKGELYIDLEHPLKVCTAGEHFPKPGHVLPKTAVHESTWNKIVEGIS
jgi:hypothetical protein